MQSDLLPAHKFDILLHIMLNLLGWGLGGVGWGMLTFACTCVMKLMLRHGWGGSWVGWGGAC